MVYLILVIFITFTAFAVGVIVGSDLPDDKRGSVIGKITINKTNPSEDFLDFTFEKDLPAFENSNYVTFRVIRK